MKLHFLLKLILVNMKTQFMALANFIIIQESKLLLSFKPLALST